MEYNADFLNDGTIRMKMSEISIGNPTDNFMMERYPVSSWSISYRSV